MKKWTLSKYKRELDRVFSLYIRAKYGDKCYTCGRQGKLQAGHFISRLYLATRWDENNSRPQCVGCNIWGGGKPLDFEENLKKELGIKALDKMKQKRHTVVKMTVTDYQNLIKKYSC